MYDLWDTACKRNGFIKYVLVLSAEQSLSWQIEYKIFLYAVINFCHDHPPPAHPRGFALKTLPHSGAFAS